MRPRRSRSNFMEYIRSIKSPTMKDAAASSLSSAGNARYEQWLALAEQHPQLQLSEKIHQPAQAANVLTVGAYTARVTLPGSKDYEEAKIVAKHAGGISPFTSTGLVGNEWSIKPDIVMEGGNLAISGPLPERQRFRLSAPSTTSHRQHAGSTVGADFDD